MTDNLKRRDLLAGLSATGISVAGCSGSGSGPDSDCRKEGGGGSAPEDTLLVDVSDIQSDGDRYTARVTVSNSNGSSVHTQYTGVQFHAYDHTGVSIPAADIGTLDPDEEWTRRRAFDRFPFLVTASAEDSAVLRDCWRPMREAETRGYVGFYDDAEPFYGESGGHVWEFLGTRPAVEGSSHFERNTLPLGDTYLRQAKCNAQNFDRVRGLEEPSFPLPLDTSWMDAPIPRDGSDRSVAITYLGEPESQRRVTDLATIDNGALPQALRPALAGGAVEDLSVAEALDVVDEIEDSTVCSLADLPTCRRGHVTCSDDRWSNCLSGDAAYDTGSLRYRIWYYYTGEERVHTFRFTFIDDW